MEPESNEKYICTSTAVYRNKGTCLQRILDTSIRTFTIPDSVTSIDRGAFSGCTQLESITLPDSIKDIGIYAFSGCTSLKEIKGGTNVSWIGERAFNGTPFLKTAPFARLGRFLLSWNDESDAMRIPKGITEIWPYFHHDHDRLPITTIILPDGFRNIPANAFSSFLMLEKVYLPATVEHIDHTSFPWSHYPDWHFFFRCFETDPANPYYAAADGVLFSKDMHTLVLYPSGRTQPAYVIPESVENIAPYAFMGCHGLREIIFPHHPISFLVNKDDQSGAFSFCTFLEKADLPPFTKRIPADAFKDCRHLHEIHLPDGLESVETDAFYRSGFSKENEDFTQVILPSFSGEEFPDSLRTISSGAFQDLTMKRITLPAYLESIGEGNFSSAGEINVYDTAKAEGLGFYSDVRINVLSHKTRKCLYSFYLTDRYERTSMARAGALAWKGYGNYDFSQTDPLFPSIIMEKDSVITALLRLEYPKDLQMKYRRVFQKYLDNSSLCLLKEFLENKEGEYACMFVRHRRMNQQEYDQAMKTAVEARNTDLIRCIMEHSASTSTDQLLL